MKLPEQIALEAGLKSIELAESHIKAITANRAKALGEKHLLRQLALGKTALTTLLASYETTAPTPKKKR